jgi:hypothetical protein
MVKGTVTRRLPLRRREGIERGSQGPACRRSRSHSYRPLVEILEDLRLPRQGGCSGSVDGTVKIWKVLPLPESPLASRKRKKPR